MSKPRFELIVKEDKFTSGNRAKFCFVVVDLELGEKYPANFVAVLPKYLTDISESKKTTFEKLFENREQAIAKAKELLNKLKAKTTEPEILAEIKKRLKLLEPSSWQIAKKCIDCKMPFMPKCPRHRRCHDCAVKNHKSYMAWLWQTKKAKRNGNN